MEETVCELKNNIKGLKEAIEKHTKENKEILQYLERRINSIEMPERRGKLYAVYLTTKVDCVCGIKKDLLGVYGSMKTAERAVIIDYLEKKKSNSRSISDYITEPLDLVVSQDQQVIYELTRDDKTCEKHNYKSELFSSIPFSEKRNTTEYQIVDYIWY